MIDNGLIAGPDAVVLTQYFVVSDRFVRIMIGKQR